MRKLLAIFTILYSSAAIAQPVSLEKKLEEKRVQLPNGWQLSPAGKSLPLGDLPLNIVTSPSKKYIAATNNGQSVQSIQLIDAKADKILDQYIVSKSWYGLTFSSDEKTLYASGGNDNWILVFSITNKKIVLKDSIVLGNKWPEKISPAGIAVHDQLNRLFVVTKENNSLYVIDLKTKNILQKLPLGYEAYTCLLSPDKKELFISIWGGDKIAVYDIEQQKITDEIKTGDNPNELLLSKNGKLLYVANANDNSISVINLKENKVIEVLNTALFADAPTGSTTNGMALNEKGNRLYVANADNNCLAVFDVTTTARSKSLGFIPVGWYPTNIEVIRGKLYVSNGKGFSSFPNPKGPNPVRPQENVVRHQSGRTDNVEYIGGLMKGTMSILPEPNEAELAIYSRAVYKNTPYNKDKEMNAPGEAGNPVPMKVGDPSPIKYVFYIIKENRTYDQVFGDMPEGNGDTSLVLFGEKITPNHHKLVRDYVLLDNFYADGEVSMDGHNWTMSANATDYLEKNWPTSYGGRGGSYDGEGNRAVANPSKGFIWDYCKRAGISYRTYAEFADNGKANIPSLEGHFCPYYTEYDLSVRDTTRFHQWKRDFDSLLSLNAVPQFNSLRFGNDHTEGLRFGRPTPFAHVADNDLALGMFVDYLSKTPIWKESVIFVIEDDAQNGADHVDAHRTVALVIGPHVKRNFVDHTMYSTSSMLRTIELILGLPPMSQYDAAATPMWRSFTADANTSTYNHLPANVDLNELNKSNTASAKLSETFDFSKEDLIPDLIFSQVIWKAVKGENSEMPAPRRSSFLKLRADEDDEEEEAEEKEEKEKAEKKKKYKSK